VFATEWRPPRENILLLKELLEAGKYRAVVDRTYPLEDVVEATRYVESWQKTGNVVLSLGDDSAWEHVIAGQLEDCAVDVDDAARRTIAER
jgi:hypothetical protein